MKGTKYISSPEKTGMPSRITCVVVCGLIAFYGAMCFSEANAQSATAAQKYDNLERVEVRSYQPTAQELLIQMDYGKYQVLNPTVFDSLAQQNIVEIRLVYTDHPVGRSFQVLNTNRLKTLQRYYEGIFARKDVRWYIVKQTHCPSKELARSYFHGFAITVAKSPKSTPTPTTTPTTPVVTTEDKTPEPIEPDPVRRVMQQIPRADRMYLSTGYDTVSLQVIRRNHDQWGNYIVTVSDWTSSMYPYTTQVLRWHLEHEQNSKIRDFVFFNDGDKKRDIEKKKGKVGGIYSIQADSVPQVIALMKFVRSMGDGGDIQENDIEALLWAMEKYPQADEFAFIADNKSDMRDYSMMSKVSKDRPVRIILGRLPEEDFAYLNLQYIDLALHTRGSIHTFSHDFYTKEELTELRKKVKQLRSELKKGQP